MRLALLMLLALALACSEPRPPASTPIAGDASVEPEPDLGVAADPCAAHCTSGQVDCGETGRDCGGDCSPCPPPPAPVDDAALEAETLAPEMECESAQSAQITVRNTGTSTWSASAGYALAYDPDTAAAFLPPGAATRVGLAMGEEIAPGQRARFVVELRAPTTPAVYPARFQLHHDAQGFGAVVQESVTVSAGCMAPAQCDFPDGVPEEGFIAAASSAADTDPAVDEAVNEVMAELTGCGVGSRCPIVGLPGTSAEEVCQSWFMVVDQALRERGLCAGQHLRGQTDEIAVSNTGCTGRWYGYHVCFYGGPAVVWTPGARRGWWQIAPEYCP